MSNFSFKFDKVFFRDFWRLCKPYWQSEEKKSAWLLLFLNVFFVAAEVYANVGYNHFNKIFFDALQNLNRTGIIVSLKYLLLVVFGLSAAGGGAMFVNGMLAVRWRRWLTTHYLQKWLSDHYYHARFSSHSLDNPDQRISEDLNEFPTMTLNLLFGQYAFLHSVLLIISFGYILWGLSKNFIFHFHATAFSIPGYLCLVAFIYSVIGSWLINLIGKKLMSLNYQQQKTNADFRYSLMRVREANEQVAFHRGEVNEKKKFQTIFSHIFNNTVKIVTIKSQLSFFSQIYNMFAYLLGLMISLPFCLAKVFQLGVMMQISNAFSSVSLGFSAFINFFNNIAEWRAVMHRLIEFHDVVDREIPESKIKINLHDDASVIIKNLKLNLPCGKSLQDNIDLEVSTQKRILISGRSGVGKSTLMRALAGLWPHGEGKIYFPKDAKIVFVPQKSYLPLGSLKDLLCYSQIEFIDDEKLKSVLALCALEKYQSHLHEIKNWSHELSLGEQQLLGFARIFLSQPDVIFLDEATSALDEKTESAMHENLRQYLPNAIVVSVAHRSSLQQFYDSHYVLPA